MQKNQKLMYQLTTKPGDKVTLKTQNASRWGQITQVKGPPFIEKKSGVLATRPLCPSFLWLQETAFTQLHDLPRFQWADSSSR